ncbi:14566_t:CDS:2, partial [Gigaspora margarita]
DIPIIDNAYNLEDEKAAETGFEKLITNAHNLDKDSRWRYTGNSVRTRQQKLQENRINAIGSCKITEFFDKANNMNLNNNKTTQLDYAKRIQHLIDTNETSKTDKVKYISVIHYIKLLQNNTPKLEASRIVAHIHNGSEYRARYMRAWAKKCLEAQTISLATSRRWMIKMGFNYKWYKKGVYVNGHEREDVILLRKKGLDVSEFLTKTIGRLKDKEGEARVIVETGGSQDENWDREKLLIWAFDNATSHTVMAPDALVAARMNLYPGDKQPKMRNTTWNGETQTMVYPDNYEVLSLRSEPKGMKAVFNERGLWKNGL